MFFPRVESPGLSCAPVEHHWLALSCRYPGDGLGRRRTGVSLLVICAVLLAIVGWSPIGPAALMVLEDRIPRPALGS